MANDDETAGRMLIGAGARSAPVWRRSSRFLLGVAQVRSGPRTTLRVCTIAAPRRQRARASTVRATGSAIKVSRGSTVIGSHVADPWIAWATQDASTKRVRVHRRRIEGPRARTSSRTFAGALAQLVTTPRGTVLANMLTKTRQHLWRWTPGRRVAPLVPARRISHARDAPDALEPSVLRAWEPGTVNLTTSTVDDAQLVDVDGRRTCRRWDTATPAVDVRTDRLRAVIDTSPGWSHRVVFDGSTWSSEPTTVESAEHLKVCDDHGRRLFGVTTGGPEDGAEENTTEHVAIVGEATIVYGYGSNYDGGSGNSGGPSEQIYVPSPTRGARPSHFADMTFVVATTSAAAWVDDRQLWASDLDGVHRLGPVSNDLQGLRLDGSRLTLVRPGGNETRSLSRLLPAATSVPDDRDSDAHFGICFDRLSARCPVPPATD